MGLTTNDSSVMALTIQTSIPIHWCVQFYNLTKFVEKHHKRMVAHSTINIPLSPCKNHCKA